MTQTTTVSNAKEATPYLDDVIQKFVLAATFWGVVGFLVGDFIAWQLAFPALNLDLEWFSFGRVRPVHTSAVIFAFGGNVLLATSFYVVQRTCRARAVRRRGARQFHLLGLPAVHRPGRARAMSWASPRARNMPSRNGIPIFG